ncbi:MAG TPA: hypothetical protein PK675_03155 [Clostridia bacterium]|nr:hypothetical protein [Clostridia bacterium]
MKNYALIGNNINESLSPKIWRFLANKSEAELTYELCELPVNISDEILLSHICKYDGVNVTSPFKNQVADLLNIDFPVNLVVNDKGLKGYSLDGLGVVTALTYHGTDVCGKKIIVLGAGGAAESAIIALLYEGAKVAVINRTQKKADFLTQKYGLKNPFKNSYGVMVFVNENADLFFAKPYLDTAEFVFNANYKHKSEILEEAKRKGKKTINGLSMLFFQGLASFEICENKKFENIEELYREFLKEL